MSGSTDEKEGASMPAVHSANQWESASFGEDGQREKFLRLMGGMKKQRTGRFVIGESSQESHARTDDENKQMVNSLDNQYRVGLEKKLAGQNRRHVGLGFAEPEKAKEEQPTGTHVRFGDADEGVETGEKSSEDPKDDPRGRREEHRGKDEGDHRRRDEEDHKRRDRDRDRERRHDREGRDEKRRERSDDNSRRRSSEQDAERGSREKGRDKDRERSRDHKSREDSGKRRDHQDGDSRERKRDDHEKKREDQSESGDVDGPAPSKLEETGGHDDGTQKREREADETTEQKRKKHKHREKTNQEDSGSDSE